MLKRIILRKWMIILYFFCKKAVSYMINDVPLSFSPLSSLTLPPIFSIMCLKMLRQSLVPWLFNPQLSASLLKLWNSFPMFSFDMPIPESFITISNEIYKSSKLLFDSSFYSSFSTNLFVNFNFELFDKIFNR